MISKQEPYGKKNHLNTLLDIVIMMTLDHYVQSFLKWLGMLNALIVTRQCLSIKVIDKKLFKKYTRI